MPSRLRMLLSLLLLLAGCAGGSPAPSPAYPPGSAATLRPTVTLTCAPTLIPTPTFDPFWVTSILCAQNVHSNRNPGQGRPARFFTPIAIDPNDIPAVLDAIHQGTTPACRYAVDGYPYPIAEHELAHALGLAGHFDGFTGDEGLSPQLIAVPAALIPEAGAKGWIRNS